MKMKNFQERVHQMQNEMDSPGRIMDFIRIQDAGLLRDWVVGEGVDSAAAVTRDLLKWAEPGYLAHAEFLLGLGAKINDRDAWQGWFNIATRILTAWEKGGTPEPEDQDVEQAMFDLLSRRGVGMSSPIGKHWSPPHQVVAVFKLHPGLAVERLAQLKGCGYEIDARDEIGETPLMVACRMHQVEIAQWLLDHGADPTKRTQGGNGLIQYFSINPEMGESDGWRRAKEILKACQLAGHDINLLLSSEKDAQAPEALKGFLCAMVEGRHLENKVPAASPSVRARRI